jgi:hypothetical protein
MDKAPLGNLLTDDLGGGDLNAGLWWAGADYAARPYVLPTSTTVGAEE